MARGFTSRRAGLVLLQSRLDVDAVAPQRREQLPIASVRRSTTTATPRAAVGGVVAAAVGDPAVFVSVGAMHQGPQGGGPVIAIVDVSE